MNRMINKLPFKLIPLLWIAGIVWNVYSYFCIGIIHRYDLYGIKIIPSSADNLDAMWKAFSLLVIINSSMMLLAFIELLIKNKKNIRRGFYITSIITSTLYGIFWEINYRESLMACAEGYDLLVHILKPGYYSYIIVVVIIVILLLLLEELKECDSYTHKN